MAKQREDALVVCPYYKEDGPQQVHCEGILEGGSLHLGFPDKGQLRTYKSAYCRDHWELCRIAGLLNEKYADGQ